MTRSDISAPKADALPDCATPRPAVPLGFEPVKGNPATAVRGSTRRNTARTGNESPGIVPNRAAILSRLIRERREREQCFDADLFADPAWDILLDLAHASATGRRLCVTAVCIGSGVPTTTALRWIGLLIDAGLVEREDDPFDRRRGWLALTEAGRDAMDGYLARVAGRWQAAA